MRRVVTGLVAAAVGVTASFVVASPAQAVAGLIVTIDWSDLTGSESTKSANAVCPAGKVVYGGGVDIIGGGSEVRITAAVPALPGLPAQSYFGQAREDGSYAGNWTMYTWAICGSVTSGWQVVSYSASASAGTNILGIHLACPAGKKVIGTGGRATGSFHNIIHSMVPNAALTEVSVELAADETSDVPLSGTAYAVCINPVPGQQRVSATTAENSFNKYISVNCPRGTKLHGTGAAHNGGGQVYFDRIGLIGLGAVEGSDAEAHEDQTGYADPWSLTAYAICAG